MNTGKCPGCGQVAFTVNVERINISSGPAGATWVGVSYVCPNPQCRTLLGVSIDPVALKTDIVREIGKKLKAMSP